MKHQKTSKKHQTINLTKALGLKVIGHFIMSRRRDNSYLKTRFTSTVIELLD
jgi:hypothetical protein